MAECESSTQLVNPGLFHTKYIAYTIIVNPSGEEIVRRYSDFDALRQELVKNYPGYVIPAIPKKKITKKSETTFVQKRQDLLQRFLNELLRHPVLKNSELVHQFLTLSSKDWELRVRTTAKASFAKEMSDLRTVQGAAKVEITEENIKYCEQLSPMIAMAKERYKILQNHNKNIAADMEKLGLDLGLTGGAYAIIGTTFEAMGDSWHSVLFNHMSDAHKRLGDIYGVFKEVFLAEVASFYRFYKYEMSALEELVAAQKAAGVSMNVLEKRLWSKKESRFGQKNLATWELEASSLASAENLLTNKPLAFQEMLAKETAEVRKSRMMYGYYTNKVKEEYHRIIKKDRDLTLKQFERIPTLTIKHEEDILEAWNDLLRKMRSFHSGQNQMAGANNSSESNA
eukprot:TRINITY_DN1356_c0_g4_i1.p1 TRINITY_DN1356_c0_g4~~TRINITY_DN1356_c0_g4_i1.p1  ORF type:complete len:398 (+),score=92.63 TRINITY_DN1356_c0_g4_i1:628-1821(+)